MNENQIDVDEKENGLSAVKRWEFKLTPPKEFDCGQCGRHFKRPPKTNIMSSSPEMPGCYQWSRGIYRIDLCGKDCEESWIKESRPKMIKLQRQPIEPRDGKGEII